MATAFACNWNNQFEGVAFNDISIDDGGNLRTIEYIPDLEQSITQSLWLWKSEYLFNTFIGMPYRLILGNPAILPSLIRYFITLTVMSVNEYLTPNQLALYGIKEIVSIEFDFNNNTRTNNTIIVLQLNNSQQLVING